MSIRWSPAQRERAKAVRETLWAAGYDGPKGRMEFAGMMPDESALALIRFSQGLYQGHRQGLTPAEAMASAIEKAMEGDSS